MANVSRTGAMLVVKNPEWLPKNFQVVDTFTGKKRRANNVWIEGNKIGIRFQAAADLVPNQVAQMFGRRHA